MNNYWKNNTMANASSNNFGIPNTSNFGLSSNSNFGNAGNFSNSFGNANNPNTFGNQGMTSNFGTTGNFSNTFGATTANPNSFGNQGMNSNFGSNFGNTSGMNNTGVFGSQPMSSNFGTSGNFATSMNASTPFGTQQMNSNFGNNPSSFGNNSFQANPNQPSNSMWQTSHNQPPNSLWQTNMSQPTNSMWQAGNPNKLANSMWQTSHNQPPNSLWQTNMSQPTNSMWQTNTSQPTNSMWGTNTNNTSNFMQQNTNPMNSGFMQNQNNQQGFFNNQFGNAVNGSSVDYRQTSTEELTNISGKKQPLSVNYVSLSAMPEYSNKSIEEIRYEDYAANRKMGAPVNMQGNFNTNSFGNTGLGTSNFMSGMNQSLPGNSIGNQLFPNTNTAGGFMNAPISQTNSNFWSTAGTNNSGQVGISSGFQTANSGLGNRLGFPVNNTPFSAVNSGFGNTPGLLGTNTGIGISAPNGGVNTSGFPSSNTGFGISSNFSNTNATGFPQSNVSLGNNLGFPSTNTGLNTVGFPTGNTGVNTGGFPSGNTGVNTVGFPSANTGVNTVGFPTGNTGGFPSANTGVNTVGFPTGNTGVNTAGFPAGNTGVNTGGFPTINTGFNTAAFPASNTGFNTGGFPSTNTGLNAPGFPTINTGLNTAGFTGNATGGNTFGFPAANTGINTFPGTNNKPGFPSTATNTSVFPASNNLQNNTFGGGFQNNNTTNLSQMRSVTQSQISIPHVESSFYPPDMREKMEQIDRAVSLNSYSDISRDLLTYIACSPYSAINKHCDSYTDGTNTKEAKKSSKTDESFLKSYKNDSFIDRYNINSSWERLNRSALNYLTVHSHESESNASFTPRNKKLGQSTPKSLNNSSKLLPLYSVTQPGKKQTLLRSPPKRRCYKELSVRISSLKTSLLNRIPMHEVDTNVPEKGKENKSQASNCESSTNVEDLTSSVAFQPMGDACNMESSITEIKTNLSKEEHEFVSTTSEDLIVRCSDSSYFLIPSLGDINLLAKENKPIHDLTVAKPGFGSIKFLKPVTLTCMDISETVCIGKNIIELYPDNNWPPQGEGLNVHARVNVLNCWPYGKNSGSFIKDPDLIENYGWVENLKEQTKEMDATFISYTLENGEWVFEINKC